MLEFEQFFGWISSRTAVPEAAIDTSRFAA
jgi:hypothetical protein